MKAGEEGQDHRGKDKQVMQVFIVGRKMCLSMPIVANRMILPNTSMESVNMSCYMAKKNFADVIKVSNLHVGRLS
jgi:hypothetical protein